MALFTVTQLALFLPLILIVLFISYFLYYREYYAAKPIPIVELPEQERPFLEEPEQQAQQQHNVQENEEIGEEPTKPTLPKKMGKKKLLSKQKKQDRKAYNAFIVDQRETQLIRKEEKQEELARRRRKKGINWTGLTKNTYKDITTFLDLTIQTVVGGKLDKEIFVEINDELVSELFTVVKEHKIMKLSTLSQQFSVPADKIFTILSSQEPAASSSVSSFPEGKILRNKDLIIYVGAEELHEIHDFVIERGRVDKEELVKFVANLLVGEQSDSEGEMKKNI